MTTPAYHQHQPGVYRMNESIRSKLPRANNARAEERQIIYEPSQPPPPEQPRRWSFKFLPAFWTIASVLSMIVNLILIIILLLAYQQLERIRELQAYGLDRSSGLLGGLYENFVKMDQATIATTIPVQDDIPLDIEVPVQTTTQIWLAEPAVIPNAHVLINTGGLSINASARVTLPAETPLVVRLDFPLNVQNEIPISLQVPVNIPLNQTELHEPFVGLQKVVEPWYCLVQPDATVNGLQVCSQTRRPAANPAVTEPTPVGTVIP
ncbi:MAG: hypothetical protein M3Y68_06295 [Chloroflexota bacterium]|nr:hypothetical protein [Chloroflexota bacterium]